MTAQFNELNLNLKVNMTSKNVELDENLLTKYVNSEDLESVNKYLTEKFTVAINDSTKEPELFLITEATVTVLSNLLRELSDKVFKNPNENAVCALKSVFRSLRNSVVRNPVAQNLVINDANILKNTHNVLSNLQNLKLVETKDCSLMILQFLFNIVVENSDNALKVWKTYNGIIFNLFKIPKYRYCITALLYNILLLHVDLVSSCEDIYGDVLNFYVSDEPNTVYISFLMDLFVQDLKFFSFYRTLGPVLRLVILSYVLQSDFQDKVDSFPNPKVLLEISTEFKKKSDCILKTVANYVDQIEPEEVVKLLEILAKLSANERHCKHLQGDKGLLINCAFLLRSIHSIGKEFQNNFTAIPKLSEVTSRDSSLNNDVTFGFKANLIRLLGNLCWKHRSNQDEVRELECIPLLLDCCNIDARNPFIIQWTIFTVRNLCENNLENQAVIAGMNRQGVVDSATLQQMGLMLHDDGSNKIGIVPLDSIKK